MRASAIGLVGGLGLTLAGSVSAFATEAAAPAMPVLAGIEVMAQAPWFDVETVEPAPTQAPATVTPPRRPVEVQRRATAAGTAPTPARAARPAPTIVRVADARPADAGSPRRCAALCGRFILIGVGF